MLPEMEDMEKLIRKHMGQIYKAHEKIPKRDRESRDNNTWRE